MSETPIIDLARAKSPADVIELLRQAAIYYRDEDCGKLWNKVAQYLEKAAGNIQRLDVE